MYQTNLKEKKKYQYPSCFVRLSPEQHEQLKIDERRSGKSAAELMRIAYFEGGPMVLLMTDEDRHEVLTQISRIGNNVNQIAKRVNTGILFGFDQEISQMRVLLSHLMTFVTSKYGLHQIRKENR